MENKEENKTIKLPMIVVRDKTMIPGAVLQLIAGGSDAEATVKKALSDDKRIFLVTERDHKTGEPFQAGTVAEVLDTDESDPRSIKVNFKGLFKGLISHIGERDEETGITLVDILPEKREVMEKEAENDPVLAKAIRLELDELLNEYMASLQASPQAKRGLMRNLREIDSLPVFMEMVMGELPFDYKLKQTFLDLANLNHRFEILASGLNSEVQVNKLKAHIDGRVRQNMDKNHRDFILREQIKVINEELDGETAESEVDEWAERCKKLNATLEIKEKIEKEIKRFKKLSANAPEANVSRGYITTLLDIPWEEMSEETDDIEEVKKALDEDHYGLEKVKERVVEALAVRNITNKGDAPILCLVGPPGTGKTSIAQSVARAMNKKYIRIALGGVHDEAEIRGHRRTYVGAIPGRIINGLINAKVKNPLLLLDEIDKVSSDYNHGDTQSALLEVLDSEQNSHFVDHYVELPVDLSEVLFISTANDISQISQPLLDRMEIIELNSYTENEKMHIAKEHLIPKQLEKNGLSPSNLKITDSALRIIISEYTAEAGVRTLERKIAAVCRKAVRQLYEKGELSGKKISVSKKNIEEYLGTERVRVPNYIHKPSVGIIHGLAWTSVGGTVLEIEVNTMPGHGEPFILTGQMGDVMKESARIALSFVRSVVKDLPEDYFDNTTIHLHIPEGAVPKDGPSAGITMATAIFSAVTGKRIDGTLAMTGEITLRGLVLPIGGLKEKLLAANKAGMKKVIVPEANRPDVTTLDKEVIGDMEIVYATKMSTVLEHAIVD